MPGTCRHRVTNRRRHDTGHAAAQRGREAAEKIDCGNGGERRCGGKRAAGQPRREERSSDQHDLDGAGIGRQDFDRRAFDKHDLIEPGPVEHDFRADLDEPGSVQPGLIEPDLIRSNLIEPGLVESDLIESDLIESDL